MKAINLISILALIFFNPLVAQQIKTIDNTGNGDFTSFNEALAYLGQLPSLPEGGVTFQIIANQRFIENPDRIQVQGTADSPIIFQKFGVGENPVILVDSLASGGAVLVLKNSAYITFDGIDITDNDPGDGQKYETAVYILASSHIAIQNCYISNFNKYGIFVKDASQHILIAQNEVYYTKDFSTSETTIYGIYVAFDSEADDVTIVNNKVYGLKFAASTLYGIRVYKVSSMIANNFISLPDDGSDKI